MKRRIFALAIAFVLLTLAACSSSETPGSSTPEPPSQSESAPPPPSSTIPQNDENSVRLVNSPTELIGTPERIILMVNEVETVFEQDSADYASILEILNNRMPEGFKEAASAFMWLDEEQQNIDWTVMAQDFDYVRLSYNDIQEITINSMAESYKDYTPSASYQDIIFPLTESELSGSTEMCILGNGAFLGILDNSEDVLSSLLSLSVSQSVSSESSAIVADNQGFIQEQ
ncbi:MAG: hypothetical protein LBU86_04070 [Oscillospiraceae bacterium]|jgi:hypothetical protein|nr:hypothetical protein [Oscillospiraceae bacterium]